MSLEMYHCVPLEVLALLSVLSCVNLIVTV